MKYVLTLNNIIWDTEVKVRLEGNSLDDHFDERITHLKVREVTNRLDTYEVRMILSNKHRGGIQVRGSIIKLLVLASASGTKINIAEGIHYGIYI